MWHTDRPGRASVSSSGRHGQAVTSGRYGRPMGMDRAGVTFASLMGLGPELAVSTARLAEELGLRLVLDRRDHRARGVLAARRGRGGGAVARPRHRRARPPAAHADGGGHGRRHAAGPAPRPRHPARRRHLVAGRHRALARRALRRPAPGPGPRVRHAAAGVPLRREGRLRRRLLPGEGLPARRPARRAASRRSSSAPSTRRCCAWPARWPTACCSTTCRRRTCRGRSSRCAAGGAGRRSTPTSTPGSASARTASSWPGATCSPTPSSTPTPATSSGPASATRSPRSARRHAAGDRDGALAAVSDRMVDAIDVMGDADTVQATMQAYVDAGVDVPVLMPLPWGPDRRGSAELTIRAAGGMPVVDAQHRMAVMAATTWSSTRQGRGRHRRRQRHRPRAVRRASRPRARPGWRSSTSTPAAARRWPPTLGAAALGARRRRRASRPTSSRPSRRTEAPLRADRPACARTPASARWPGVEATDEDWQRIWDVNVMAHVYAARAVLPGMLARGEGYLLTPRRPPGCSPTSATRRTASPSTPPSALRRVAGDHLRRPRHQGVVPVPAGRPHRHAAGRRRRATSGSRGGQRRA